MGSDFGSPLWLALRLPGKPSKVCLCCQVMSKYEKNIMLEMEYGCEMLKYIDCLLLYYLHCGDIVLDLLWEIL